MKKYRLGVVGQGGRGRGMFRWFSENFEDIVPAAACDIVPKFWYETKENDMTMAERMPDVAFYEDFDEMMAKADLDILMVETPATNHAAFCEKGLKAGVHVYSDIPTVRSLEEAQRLWKAQEASDAMFMSGSTTCGWGFILELQNLYKKGLIGEPVAMEAEYIHDCRYLWEETPWRRPQVKWGSMPIRYCTHSLGPLLSIMKEDLRTVYAVSTGSKVTDNEFANDYMSAFFQTESGIVVRMTASFINNCVGGHHSYHVYGTKGYFEHIPAKGEGHPARTVFSSTASDETKKMTELPVDFSPYTSVFGKRFAPMAGGNTGHGGADVFLMHWFMEALRSGAKEAPITLRDGLRMTIPGIYAAESVIQGGKTLRIRYPWDDDFEED
ncbi:MAG: Gfo/Idh/MocA family oxidoreductase, partial [Victivallales bacterium]|nr:Gfo/Idh/MocA family oxidoreductase [Victivallales bacterium]